MKTNRNYYRNRLDILTSDCSLDLSPLVAWIPLIKFGCW